MTDDEVKELEAQRDAAHAAMLSAEANAARWLEAMHVAEQDANREG